MFNPLKWFRKPEPSVMPKPSIPLPRLPFPQGHTLMSFRSNAALVAEVEKLQKTELWRHMQAALYNSMPGSYELRNPVVNETQSALELGRIQGYHDCLGILNALATHRETPPEQIEQTYGADPRKYNDDHWTDNGNSNSTVTGAED